MKSVIDKKSKLFLFACADESYELGKNQMFADVLPDESLGELVEDGTINDDSSPVLVRVFNNVKLVDGAFIKL